jgi:DNA-binding MarR family transcriptional regulator
VSPARQPPEDRAAAPPARPGGAAFLLAQIGAHAANRFAERVSKLGLTPPDVGLLRMIANRPGRSQQSLAADLGVVPSRVVALIDKLDRKGLVERRRSTEDRRNYALHLTVEATRVMGELRELAAVHENDICSALDRTQRAQLITLLELVAGQQRITPGVHPGYQHLPRVRPADQATDHCAD